MKERLVLRLLSVTAAVDGFMHEYQVVECQITQVNASAENARGGLHMDFEDSCCDARSLEKRSRKQNADGEDKDADVGFPDGRLYAA